jgi:5-bromo-4-chloroindolyl phosphate hydrolysis protein
MKTKGLALEEHSLIQKELKTLAEGIEELKVSMKEIEDLKAEIRAIKLFLGRAHPDFRKEFPSIVKKVSGKS